MTGSSHNVTLQVSNQSFEVDPVDIEISIDGEVVVSKTFELQGDGMPQHNWKNFQVQVEEGSHHLLARSKKGKAQEKADFQTPGVDLITIAFWSGRGDPKGVQERYLTIHLERGQAATM